MATGNGNTGGPLRGVLKQAPRRGNAAPRRVTARMQRRCGRVFQLMMDEICGGMRGFCKVFHSIHRVTRPCTGTLARNTQRPAPVAARRDPDQLVRDEPARDGQRGIPESERAQTKTGAPHHLVPALRERRGSTNERFTSASHSCVEQETFRAATRDACVQNNPSPHSRRRLERAKAAVEGKHFASRPTSLNPMGRS